MPFSLARRSARVARMLGLASVALVATGCVVYPNGAVAILPPPPPIVVSGPVYAYRAPFYYYGGYRPYYGYRYRPFWGGYRGYYGHGYWGGYRGGYYCR